MTAPTQPSPPGWYPNPHNPGQQLWWDGAQWQQPASQAPATQRPYAPAAVAQYSQPPPKKQSGCAVVAIIAVVIFGIGLIILAVIGGIAATDNENTNTDATETGPPAEEEQPPEPEAPPPPPPPVTLSGSGDGVADIDLTNYPSAIATFNHSGSANFIVTAIGGSNERLDGLVNEIGSWTGTVELMTSQRASAARLEIQADGAWDVTIEDLSGRPDKLLTAPVVVEGSSDDVFAVAGSPDKAAVSHNGEANFIVRTCPMGRTGSCDGKINEIGAYNGTVLLPREPIVVFVTADGGWSFDISG